MRIERLIHLSREKPDAPALVEFSPHELSTIVLLRRPKNYDPKTELTMGIVVRWIADLGGYTGPKSSGGPPGAKILGRGLQDVEFAAQVLLRAKEAEAEKLDQR